MLEAVCKLMKIVAKLNSNTFHFGLPIRFYLLTFQDPVKFLVTSQRHQLVFILIRRFIFDVLSSVTERLSAAICRVLDGCCWLAFWGLLFLLRSELKRVGAHRA